MAKLAIKLLGQFAIVDGEGRSVSITGAKQRALLAYLALTMGKPAPRDRLISMLWGDRFDEQARQSLRQALTKIRRLENDGKSVLLSEGDTIFLDADSVDVDALAFQRLAEDDAADSLLNAVELYRGGLLDSLFVKEAAFDEWLSGERARYNNLACSLFERAASHRHNQEDFGAAIEIGQMLVAMDPLREPSHRLLMRIFADSGQRAAALKQYASCASVLLSELDVEPDAETKGLLEEIRATDAKPEKRTMPAAPVSEPPPSTNPTIAVLPFDDLSEGEGSGARGMTEDIISALANYRWLSVLSRFSLGGDPQQFHETARKQGATYAIEGSIRKTEGRLRVNAQLIDLRSGRYIWVHRYDLRGDDLIQLQDEVTEQIAGTIEPELAIAEGQRASEKQRGNLTALELCHLGLAAQYEFNKEGNAEAQVLYRQALEVDPNLTDAYARLAYAMVIGTIYFEAKPVDEILEEALRLAKRATRLDDQDAMAHFALGRTLLARGQYEPSVRELETAIELNPSFVQAHCGLGDSLAYSGRLGESIPRFEEAVRLSPHDPHRWAFWMYGAMAHLFRHEHEEAAKWGAEAVGIPNSHYGANAALVAALGHLERRQETEAALAELLELKPDFSCRLARERLFYLEDQSQLDHYIDGLRNAGLPE